MLSCLSIVVAKLTGNQYVGNELPDPTIPAENPTDFYDDYVELQTITRCKVERTMVYDEGDTRILYHDYVVDIEAVITNTQEFGPVLNPIADPDAYSFDEKLELLSNFLSNQGLGINFGSYPASIKRIVPGNEDNETTTEYEGYHGWLIDNFNGPKPDRVIIEPMAGEDTARLSWTVRFRTYHTDIDQQSVPLVPRISSELRLDIDKDGDLAIFVDGTVYADSLKALYQARNWLEIIYQPSKVENIIESVNGDPEHPLAEDYFAVVNGFLKTVQFNVEKNGRSARFNIRYTQVKSNNAYPLGLRDVNFTQTLESSLIGSSVFSGKGFRSWKNSFKGKIRIPNRLNAEYAWYVFHLLVQQQMRNTVLSFARKDWDLGNNELVDGEAETSEKLSGRQANAKAIPIRLKVSNSHFSRELTFEIDYVIMCPIQYILSVSCIFKRINNDYQRRITQGNSYKPLKLSAQWWYWNRSVEQGIGFDPEAEGAVNPYASGRPHLDSAGTEILDTGHNYDPYRELEQQSKQRNVLITTVFDPHEKDRVYETNDPSDPDNSGYAGSSIPLNIPKTADGNSKNWTGLPPVNPFLLLTTNSRGQTPEYDPKSSWLEYKQDYEIIEDAGTVPATGMADMDASYYQNEELYRKYVNSTGRSNAELPSGAVDTSLLPLDNLPNAEVGAKFAGRTLNNEISIDAYEQAVEEELIGEENDPTAGKLVTHRKSYASTPSRYFVVVRGMAMRVKHKIPMPQVITIAGEKAIRVGEGRFKHKNLAPDADLPVYLAMWEQTYTVDTNIVSDDILSSIVDTGASMLYA